MGGLSQRFEEESWAHTMRLGGRVRGQFSANGLSMVDAVMPVARVRGRVTGVPTTRST